VFGWGKRNKPRATSPASEQSTSEGDPIISAVLMEGDTFSSGEFEKQLLRSAIGGQGPASVDRKESILTFQLGDELAAVAPMPAPYPWSDLKGPCATSWMWPKQTPATTLERHRSHVLITLIGGKSDPIPRRMRLTQLTALAAQQAGVLGVYWPDATLVHYPPVFVKMAQAIKSAEAPPLYLWVDFRVFRNPDGSSGMFTTGLRALGRMEVEIPKIKMPPGELRDWAVNIAYYLLDAGTKVKDGDTIGMSAEQQIRILHRPSMFGAEGLVMQFQT
jgi:hypothetical protein